MFNLDKFVEECRSAVKSDSSHSSVKALLEEACSEPNEVLRALGEPSKAGAFPIYNSPDLTILNLVWGRNMSIMPHNHEMWAVIGLYTGRENNIFWRQLPEDAENDIEAAGAKSMGPGDVSPLGKDIIHSVTNPLDKLTGALHVYGGDFFSVHRTEWDAEDLAPRPYDIERNIAAFAAANGE
jgi:predicted metal-dependent enzyme (double-stranded beta helix superfamily)